MVSVWERNLTVTYLGLMMKLRLALMNLHIRLSDLCRRLEDLHLGLMEISLPSVDPRFGIRLNLYLDIWEQYRRLVDPHMRLLDLQRKLENRYRQLVEICLLPAELSIRIRLKLYLTVMPMPNVKKRDKQNPILLPLRLKHMARSI